MDLTFEWDEEKANSNFKKHRVAFEEGKTVFGDPIALTIHGPSHSFAEDRYVTIGRSSKGRVLFLVYTDRTPNLRFITCRLATRSERKQYEEG